MKKQTLHARLRAARLSQGLTLRDIEKLSRGHICNAYVSKLERGKEKNPSPKKLHVMAKILKLDIIELYFLAGYLVSKHIEVRK